MTPKTILVVTKTMAVITKAIPVVTATTAVVTKIPAVITKAPVVITTRVAVVTKTSTIVTKAPRVITKTIPVATQTPVVRAGTAGVFVPDKLVGAGRVSVPIAVGDWTSQWRSQQDSKGHQDLFHRLGRAINFETVHNANHAIGCAVDHANRVPALGEIHSASHRNISRKCY